MEAVRSSRVRVCGVSVETGRAPASSCFRGCGMRTIVTRTRPHPPISSSPTRQVHSQETRSADIRVCNRLCGRGARKIASAGQCRAHSQDSDTLRRSGSRSDSGGLRIAGTISPGLRGTRPASDDARRPASCDQLQQGYPGAPRRAATAPVPSARPADGTDALVGAGVAREASLARGVGPTYPSS